MVKKGLPSHMLLNTCKKLVKMVRPKQTPVAIEDEVRNEKKTSRLNSYNEEDTIVLSQTSSSGNHSMSTPCISCIIFILGLDSACRQEGSIN